MKNLSLVARIACAVVGVDPELLIDCPLLDRAIFIGEGILLLVVALASGCMWMLFCTTFFNPVVGVLAGLFFAGFILLVDRAVGMAEWALTGILKRPGVRHSWSHWVKPMIRLTMTLVLGLGTSTGAMMEAEKVTIEHRIEAERYIANQKITNNAEAQKVNTRKQALGPSLDEAGRLKRIAADASAALDTARVECAKAKSEQEIADTEAERELKGHPGYRKGAGPNYRAALKKKQDADAALAKCEAQVGIYEPRAVEANRKLDAVNARLQAGDERIRPEIEKIEAAKDKALIPPGFDPLMGYMALNKLYDDPVIGQAARGFSWLLMAILMTVELSYFAVRTVFQPASIYNVLLIERTNELAEGISAKAEMRRHALRIDVDNTVGPRPALPPLRIIGGSAG